MKSSKMNQAQPSTTTPEATLRPASGWKTATGVSDTWNRANLWERQTFTTELRWGVRYSQSDPMWTNGNGNEFGYAAGNPIVFTDPLGLFTWKCNVSEGSFFNTVGAAGFYVECKRKCYKQLRYSAKYFVWGLGVGFSARFSLPFSATYWDVNDRSCSTGGPGCLSGYFQIKTASLTTGAGPSHTEVRMGHATTSGWGAAGGVGAGGYVAWGWSNLISDELECCDLEPPDRDFIGPEDGPPTMGPADGH